MAHWTASGFGAPENDWGFSAQASYSTASSMIMDALHAKADTLSISEISDEIIRNDAECILILAQEKSNKLRGLNTSSGLTIIVIYQ
ncbi:hypothetical protein [Mesorhizobium dulcispinae]|uniref:hypothetical protein n=1 Tax=Mesorhizobium dulcispinae TaxID=3072316 RepID=UPI002A23FDBA|nr:hypothetical protein [Mesorhizobium sp. VK23D]MDX8520290.1 hypothetical protein [Mesorhizobium sp. VK23D]